MRRNHNGSLTDETYSSSRRRVLRGIAGVGAIGLGGIGSAQSDPSPVEGGSTIELGGRTSGWVGEAPSSIEGTTNPTLVLEAGAEYTVRWENLDGMPHDFYVLDSDGNEIEGTGTELVTEQGGTGSVTFTATEEMAEYYCSVHPTTMRGSVTIQSGGGGGGDDGGGGGDDGGGGGDDGGGDDGGDQPPAVVGDARPTDPDGDGIYEDVDGDGEVSYDDTVDLFDHFEEPAVQENADAYDANGNGRLDFNDIIRIFRSS